MMKIYMLLCKIFIFTFGVLVDGFYKSEQKYNEFVFHIVKNYLVFLIILKNYQMKKL